MTKEEIREFKKLVKWAKKNGVTEYDPSTGAFKLGTVTETETPKKSAKDKETDPALLKNDPSAGMPPDSDMLFYHTDAFDILKAERNEDEPPRNT